MGAIGHLLTSNQGHLHPVMIIDKSDFSGLHLVIRNAVKVELDRQACLVVSSYASGCKSAASAQKSPIFTGR
jgi:hypothetical protein